MQAGIASKGQLRFDQSPLLVTCITVLLARSMHEAFCRGRAEGQLCRAAGWLVQGAQAACNGWLRQGFTCSCVARDMKEARAP